VAVGCVLRAMVDAIESGNACPLLLGLSWDLAFSGVKTWLASQSLLAAHYKRRRAAKHSSAETLTGDANRAIYYGLQAEANRQDLPITHGIILYSQLAP